MRIATFNANSIRTRLNLIVTWMTQHHPDILCLQETKVEDAVFPALPFVTAGYHVAFRGEKAYNGVAIVSRKKPHLVQFGLDDGGSRDETRLIYARWGPIHVVNTYVPQGRDIEHPMYTYKLEWFRRLRAYWDRHFTPRMKVAWVGDLNVAPDYIDIHNAQEQEQHVCFHSAVRQRFAETVAWGFVDVFRKHHPEPGLYTFFDYRTPRAVERNLGWRVDHILATPPLAARSRDAFIDLESRRARDASDHAFLVADFNV